MHVYPIIISILKTYTSCEKQNVIVTNLLFSGHVLSAVSCFYLKYNKKFWEEITAYLPLIRLASHRKRSLQQFLISSGMCLPSRCLAKCIYRHTEWWEAFMKYAVQMGSVAIIYTRFHKDWFRHSKINKRTSQTHKQEEDRISLLSRYRCSHGSRGFIPGSYIQSSLSNNMYSDPRFYPTSNSVCSESHFRGVKRHKPKCI
jgi:hypothetical protein